MKALWKRLKSQSGMTLVEVIVSLAILSLLAILLTSVFSSSVMIVGKQAMAKKGNLQAAGGIETVAKGFAADANVSVNQTSGSFTITFQGVTVVQEGTYYEGTAAGQQGSYTYFEPKAG